MKFVGKFFKIKIHSSVKAGNIFFFLFTFFIFVSFCNRVDAKIIKHLSSFIILESPARYAIDNGIAIKVLNGKTSSDTRASLKGFAQAQYNNIDFQHKFIIKKLKKRSAEIMKILEQQVPEFLQHRISFNHECHSELAIFWSAGRSPPFPTPLS
ncbi:MAG: hypothetical protein ACP5JP_07320 [bacterium]